MQIDFIFFPVTWAKCNMKVPPLTEFIKKTHFTKSKPQILWILLKCAYG